MVIGDHEIIYFLGYLGGKNSIFLSNLGEEYVELNYTLTRFLSHSYAS